MKNKGAIRLFAIIFGAVCLFQLSFSLFTYFTEEDAVSFASSGKTAEIRHKMEKSYLDSMKNLEVYPLLGFTYKECKDREINLGLDLKGGMNVTLEVSIPDLIKNLSRNNPNSVFNKALIDAGRMAENSQEDFVTLFDRAFRDVAPNDKLAAIFSNADNKDIKPTSSNEEVIKFIRKEAEQAIDRSFQILRSRIDKFGTSQPKIQKLGSTGRILVELPGVDDPERVRKLLQGTAKLQFFHTYLFKDFADTYYKRLNEFLRTSATVAIDTNNASDTSKAAQDRKRVLDSLPLFKYLTPSLSDNPQDDDPSVGYAQVKDTSRINGYLNAAIAARILPPDMYFSYEAKPLKGSQIMRLYCLKKERSGEALMEGDKVIDANKDLDQNGQITVNMTMNPDGAREWARITSANIGKCIAIVLDDAVYSAPRINSEIPNGHSQITGSFDQNEAADLANILKAGKLPAQARIVEEAVVGPTLGAENINSGLLSFVIALLLILVFMVIYYSNAGLVADIALFCNVFFIMGVLASLNAVLTMAGIAGIVLTIGLSVDANILIFERIREELHSGKGLSTAIRDGYAGAMSSILDSNITTLLLGIILYIFGTGPVQGFATTLIIGILTSLFSAIFITRLIFERWLDKDKKIGFWNSNTENLFKNIKIDWVGRRKLYYIISSVIIISGIISFIVKGFNYGVSFQGGRSYTIQFESNFENNILRDGLKPFFNNEPIEVKTFGSDNQKKITTPFMIASQDLKADSIAESQLRAGLEKVAGSKYKLVRQQKVGPTIADDIKKNAVLSVLFACILMFLYILFRFNKWQFGLGATVALLHDVLVVMSCFTLLSGIVPFSLEVDEDFIAAILTVMGYSMTDTVVVFDRIREYLTHHKKKELEGAERITVINSALNNTLSRTLITSLTIFMVLLAIFIFGGETIKGFSFSLLIGIIIGTYSSICIATPVVMEFDKDK